MLVPVQRASPGNRNSSLHFFYLTGIDPHIKSMPVVTIEQRLDRLERIAKLFVRAGLRARRNMRELDEKINMLVDAQIKAEDRLKKFDERSAKSDERFAKFDERFKELGERTDQTLAILMRLIKQGQTGRSEDPGPAKH